VDEKSKDSEDGAPLIARLGVWLSVDVNGKLLGGKVDGLDGGEKEGATVCLGVGENVGYDDDGSWVGATQALRKLLHRTFRNDIQIKTPSQC
jgi:hypothetical protein